MSRTSAPAALTFSEPSALAPRGTLVVIPGRGEQPEVYRRFGSRIAVDAYRVHVVEDPTVDEERARRQVAERSAAAVRPLILVGVDAGALFAARLAADGAPADGVILAGLPGPDEPAPASTSWEQELDARTTCPTHRGRISDDLVTPGALYRPIPPEWPGVDAIAGIAKPILAIHGREDPISAPPTALDAHVAAPRAEVVVVAGAHHDVLNDQTHRSVAATIVLWLERLRAGDDLAAIVSRHAPAVPVA